ncbi:MAG: VOC family protein [Chloroflexota bacterium]
MNPPILELRVALTAKDYETLATFYQEGLGLKPAELWATEDTHAMLFEMGRGTLELFDEAHAKQVDEIEVGRPVSGQIRFALEVPDLDAAIKGLAAIGVTLIHEPIVTPLAAP